MLTKESKGHTSNNPVTTLSEFKPNFYDFLLLVDINMPNMNGFELSERILAIDINVKVCFMSCGAEINYEVLREVYRNRLRMHHQKASQYGLFG